MKSFSLEVGPGTGILSRLWVTVISRWRVTELECVFPLSLPWVLRAGPAGAAALRVEVSSRRILLLGNPHALCGPQNQARTPSRPRGSFTVWSQLTTHSRPLPTTRCCANPVDIPRHSPCESSPSVPQQVLVRMEILSHVLHGPAEIARF